MLIVALVGLVVNIVVALYLKVFSKTDLNVKSAYLHVIADAAASVGVIIGAVIIYYTGWHMADPLISVLVAVIIIRSAINIIREASGVLLEAVPSGLRLKEIVSDIVNIEGVTGVHSLHVWSICYNVFALSAHVDITSDWKGRESQVVCAINEKLAQSHLIFYTTIQPDCTECETKELFRKIEHRNEDLHAGGHHHTH
jgi:cobalt-zinc-cadmium efflux system protein